MLDFRARKPPRNYLGKRDQYRLLLIVGLLGMVLLAMRYAASPQTWAWMRGPGEAGPQLTRDFDNRLQPATEDADLPDAFVSPAPVDEAEDRSGAYFPGVRPGYLKSVRDDTVWRPEEHQTWFHLLGLLKRNELQAIVDAAEPSSFVQLYQQPEAYRGKLVTVRGAVRRAYQVDAQQNEEGIESYYQVWLQPDGADFPMLIYCLELPSGFPLGEDLREEVSFSGFFYKRYVYPAQDGIRTAPLVLAKQPVWKPASKMDPESVPVSGLIVVVLLGVIAAGLLLTRMKAKINDERPGVPSSIRPESLQRLETGPTVEESLRQLSEQESAPS